MKFTTVALVILQAKISFAFTAANCNLEIRATGPHCKTISCPRVDASSFRRVNHIHTKYRQTSKDVVTLTEDVVAIDTSTPDILDFLDVAKMPKDVNVNEITHAILSGESLGDDGDMSLKVQSVIELWAETKTEAGTKVTKDIMESLEDSNEGLLTSHCLELVISSCLDYGQTRYAESLLQRCVDKFKSGDEKFKPSLSAFHDIMQMKARIINEDLEANSTEDKRQKRFLAAKQNIELLNVLKELGEITNELTPNLTTYNICLYSYARAGDGQKADNMLKEMVQKSIEPDLISYNHVIDSWSRSNDSDAATRAESVLKAMKENGLKPNLFSYRGTIFAFARSKTLDAADNTLTTLKPSSPSVIGLIFFSTTSIKSWHSFFKGSSSETFKYLISDFFKFIIPLEDTTS